MINSNDIEIIKKMCDTCIYNYKLEISHFALSKRRDIARNHPNYDRSAAASSKVRDTLILDLKAVTKLKSKIYNM